MSVWVALAVAAGTILFLVKSRINYLRLPNLPESAEPTQENAAIIIPARDEEKNIARAVRSFPGARVIVVDDDSRDHTAELARNAGAEVIPAPPLKDGVLGKPNACLAGARASDSKWMLFVDADTWYEPDFLNSLLRYASKEHLDAVSVFLKQECVSMTEEILLPYAFALYFCGVNARRVNKSNSRESLANGQCLLFRRNAYEFLGGHGAVAGSVIEDVALAQLAKQRSVRTRVLRAERLGHVRMYEDFSAIWRGFQKNSFRFLLVNPWSGAQVILASILLTSYLPVLVWLLVDREWIAAALFAWAPIFAARSWFSSRRSALLVPVAIYLFQLIALNAMVSTLFGVKADWKGRRV